MPRSDPNKDGSGGARTPIRAALRALSSIELTTAALLYLFVLVLIATLYQANHPVREATARFVHAWILFAGPVPLPAGQLVFAILAANLTSALIVRIPWKADRAGIIIIHLALILLLAGGIVARIGSRESVLALAEGEADSYSYDLRRWDLVVYGGTESRYPVDDPPQFVAGSQVEVVEYSDHARVVREGPDAVENVRGGRALEPIAGEAERPRPGLIVRIGDRTILLHADDRAPFPLGNGTTLGLSPRRYALPAEIRLVEFEADFFEGSQTPRSFASEVEVDDGAVTRRARISMNRPLRFDAHTIYQLGYDESGAAADVSLFHVVRNPVRWLPYAVGLSLAAGLAVHAILRLGGRRRRRRR